jgi:hypothetical protein
MELVNYGVIPTWELAELCLVKDSRIEAAAREIADLRAQLAANNRKFLDLRTAAQGTVKILGDLIARSVACGSERVAYEKLCAALQEEDY